MSFATVYTDDWARIDKAGTKEDRLFENFLYLLEACELTPEQVSKLCDEALGRSATALGWVERADGSWHRVEVVHGGLVEGRAVGHWADGRVFIVFDAFESDRLVRVCWTPTRAQERMLRQMLSGVSQ